MKIFLSYSTEDTALVSWIANQIRCHAEVYYWDESKVLGALAWETIYGWIDQSDLVIAVITDHTVHRAMSVGNEIGYAKKANKTIIPLITQNVPDSGLGCLSGVTYARITPNNLGAVLQTVQNIVIAKKREIENRTALFVIGGILAAIFIGRSDND
jgi:hypothetical protein